MRKLAESESQKIIEFFTKHLPRLVQLLDEARSSRGSDRALLWIESYEHWNRIHRAFLNYLEKLGQIFREAGRLPDLDTTVMPSPNEHFYAQGQEILEAIRGECLMRNLDTSAITRVMVGTEMVNEGQLALTKEQGSGTTPERFQHALQLLQPFTANGMPPGAALTDLLARLRHEAEREKTNAGPEVISATKCKTTAAAAPAAPPAPDAKPEAEKSADAGDTAAKPVHNADFTMVNWFGTEHTFALGVQSSAVQALWEEWERSGLGLHQDTIRNAIDPERDNFRLDTAFRNHPAFGTMIQRCGDGKYKLAHSTPKAVRAASTPKKKRQNRA